MAVLEVKHIGKHFDSTRVLDDVSFDLEEGSALAIIGSSGSGKTTLLRCLNFLETPDHGSITVREETLFDADHPVAGQEKDLRTKRLHFGMVFQAFHLFPQYTALENVTLAEKLLAKEQPDFKQKKKEILEEIEAHGKSLLDQMGLRSVWIIIHTSFPAGSSRESLLPELWRLSRISSVLMSRLLRSTRN